MQLPKQVCIALDLLQQHGYDAYVVGGAVRDSLAGKVPHDYDLCTSATPEEMKQVFTNHRIFDTGLAHGTLSVLLDEMLIEITTFREESEYSDGRRPDAVRFVRQLEPDLARRDFTVNAMAWHPTKGLIDPYHGQHDWKTKTLRAVGIATERFTEDALRILRGLRMAAETGFSLEQSTENAMYLCRKELRKIAAERVWAELKRLICGRFAGQVLRNYPDILGEVLPEILPMVGLDQKNRYHIYTVFEHSIRAMEQVPAQPALRFAALYHDTGKPDCMSIDQNGVGHFYGHPKVSTIHAKRRIEALKLPVHMQQQILFLIQNHDIPVPPDPYILRKRLAKYGEKNLRQLLMLQKADSIGRGTHPEYLERFARVVAALEQIIREKPCLHVRDLAVTGQDLLELGFHGKEIGQMQRQLLQFVLEYPQQNKKQILLALCRKEQK